MPNGAAKNKTESSEIHGTSKTKFNLSAQEIKITTAKYKTKKRSEVNACFQMQCILK